VGLALPALAGETLCRARLAALLRSTEIRPSPGQFPGRIDDDPASDPDYARQFAFLLRGAADNAGPDRKTPRRRAPGYEDTSSDALGGATTTADPAFGFATAFFRFGLAGAASAQPRLRLGNRDDRCGSSVGSGSATASAGLLRLGSGCFCDGDVASDVDSPAGQLGGKSCVLAFTADRHGQHPLGTRRWDAVFSSIRTSIPGLG